jgi:hypothetical protein
MTTIVCHFHHAMVVRGEAGHDSACFNPQRSEALGNPARAQCELRVGVARPSVDYGGAAPKQSLGGQEHVANNHQIARKNA